MVLMTTELEITWHNRTKSHYQERGYVFTKNGDKFIVKIEDLTIGSTRKVLIRCDFCKKEYLKGYGSYNDSKKKHPTNKEIDCCNKCTHKKNEKAFMVRYGVRHNFQIEENIKSRTNKIEDIEEVLSTRNLRLISTEYSHCSEKLEYVCLQHPEVGSQYLSWTELNRGYDCKYCSYDKMSELHKGKNNPNYNPNLPNENRYGDRRDEFYYYWRAKVLKRDNNKCVNCGDGNSLCAHHKDSYHWCVDRRVDISNGATLCESCHRAFHKECGIKNNTEAQFDEWLISNDKRSEVVDSKEKNTSTKTKV